MPRRARLLLDNACYHIISRGNRKDDVFRDDDDREHYISLLAHYKRKYDLSIFGWCLMNNHTHIIMESKEISTAMHGLNLSYAQYFHNKYVTIGHFWQDRYKSYTIQKDSYLINCITYIEYNPVRAGIVSRPEEYVWSSYASRVLGDKKNDILDVPIL